MGPLRPVQHSQDAGNPSKQWLSLGGNGVGAACRHMVGRANGATYALHFPSRARARADAETCHWLGFHYSVHLGAQILSQDHK